MDVLHIRKSDSQFIRCWLTRYRFVGQTGGRLLDAAGGAGALAVDPGRIARVSARVLRPTSRANGKGWRASMARSAVAPRRKPRLRTELSEADEQRLQEAVALFGLPKAEVVRRLIRASVQAGPALSADNTRAVMELASQVRMVGRNLAQVLKAIHRGQAVRIEDTEPVWRGLHDVVATINDELTEMTVAYGSKLRREAKLTLRSASEEAAP